MTLVGAATVAVFSLVPAPMSLTRREFAALATSVGISTSLPPTVALAAAAGNVPYTAQPGVKLNTGQMFPSASFGLQVYDDDTAYRLTRLALEVGYRNFFASVLARNQKGFARAVKDSGVPRSDLFICGSVLSNRVQGYDAAFKLSCVPLPRLPDSHSSSHIGDLTTNLTTMRLCIPQ